MAAGVPSEHPMVPHIHCLTLSPLPLPRAETPPNPPPPPPRGLEVCKDPTRVGLRLSVRPWNPTDPSPPPQKPTAAAVPPGLRDGLRDALSPPSPPPR